jgi:hypothetical protein
MRKMGFRNKNTEGQVIQLINPKAYIQNHGRKSGVAAMPILVERLRQDHRFKTSLCYIPRPA